MLRVPTALLLHETPTGRHHDWLIGSPLYLRDGQSGLWAARLGPESRQWRTLGRFDLTPLPPHRRAYLDYQGPVSRGRGMVKRMDRGLAVIRLWTDSRIVLSVRMRGFSGDIELAGHAEGFWRARVVF